MNTYEGFESHLLILGEKLNNFKQPKTIIEKQKYINMAKQWIKDHPDEPYNFYKQ